jgi:hypothetical protein
VSWTNEGRLADSQVGQQPLLATLAAEAAFLIATERTGSIELVVSLGSDDTGAELRNECENVAAFVGPDAGAQSVWRVVGALQWLPEATTTIFARSDGGLHSWWLGDVLHTKPAEEEG